MQTILSNKKSSVGSPYVFYTVSAEEIANTRTPTSVQLKVQVVSHLQYAQSTLGTGWWLTGYIKVNNVEHSITIKSSSGSWSGTGNHTANITFTVDNIGSSDTSLTGIKFRVDARESEGEKPGYLPSTSCSNISISMGHLAPTNVGISSVTELNRNKLPNIADNYFVEKLSVKNITLNTPVTSDEATITNQGVVSGSKRISFGNSNVGIIYLSNTILSKNENNKIILRAFATDSMGETSYGPIVEYDYTTYVAPTLSTRAYRNGQLTGNASIEVSGSYFYDANISNTVTIKYRAWEYGTTEPSSWTSTSGVSASYGSYSLTYSIGSNDPNDANYKDPNKAYQVRIYIKDSFNSEKTSDAMTISKGRPVWAEFSDRVDVQQLSIDDVIRLKTDGAGDLYVGANGGNLALRPNGVTNGTGQMFVASNGTIYTSGELHVGDSLYTNGTWGNVCQFRQLTNITLDDVATTYPSGLYCVQSTNSSDPFGANWHYLIQIKHNNGDSWYIYQEVMGDYWASTTHKYVRKRMDSGQGYAVWTSWQQVW